MQTETTILKYAEKYCGEYDNKNVVRSFLPPTLFLLMQDSEEMRGMGEKIKAGLSAAASNPDAVKVCGVSTIGEACAEFDESAHLYGRYFKLNVCIIDVLEKTEPERQREARKKIEGLAHIFGGNVKCISFFKVPDSNYAASEAEKLDFIRETAQKESVFLLGGRKGNGCKIGGRHLEEEHCELIVTTALLMEKMKTGCGIYCIGRAEIRALCRGYYIRALKACLDGVHIKDSDEDESANAWENIAGVIKNGYYKEISVSIIKDVISNKVPAAPNEDIEAVIQRMYGRSIEFFIGREKEKAKEAADNFKQSFSDYLKKLNRVTKLSIAEKAEAWLKEEPVVPIAEEDIFGNGSIIERVFGYISGRIQRLIGDYMRECITYVSDETVSSIRTSEADVNTALHLVEKMRAEVTNYLNSLVSIAADFDGFEIKEFEERLICEDVYSKLVKSFPFDNFIIKNAAEVLGKLKEESLPYCTVYDFFSPQTVYYMVGAENIIPDVNIKFLEERSLPGNVLINISKAAINV